MADSGIVTLESRRWCIRWDLTGSATLTVVDLQVGLVLVDISLRTRSMYASQGRETVHVRALAAVWMSAWRAPNGDVALVLANISDERVWLSLVPGWEAWGFIRKEYQWQLDEGAHRHSLDPMEGEWTLDMAPQGALSSNGLRVLGVCSPRGIALG